MRSILPYRVRPIVFLAIVVMLTSCSMTRHLKDNEYLLMKNSVKLAVKTPGIDVDEIHAIIQPKANSKFLGIMRAKLKFYNMGYGIKKDTKFKKWLMDKIGEPPAIYDSMTVVNSAKEIRQYLDKTGFFNSGVEFSRELKKKKQKLDVIYTIHPSKPYVIRNITFKIRDSVLNSYITRDAEESKIKPGKIFNSFDLDDERERLTAILQDNGYYYFNRNYIYFNIDSALNSHQLDISIEVKDNMVANPEMPWESIAENHKRYFINEIYIRTDFSPLDNDPTGLDTTRIGFHQIKKDRPISYYNIVYRAKPKLQPRTVTQSVFFKSGDLFHITDIKQTKSRITEVGLFGYTNIKFTEVPDTSGLPGRGLLDCNIDLSRRKLHSFTVEAEGTNSGGRPGVGFNFTYQNNNIFRGSEILRLKAHVALEAQKSLTSSEEGGTTDQPFFNTVETGFDISVDFPRFLVPFKAERFPKYFRPKTTIMAGIGYERRPEYTRTINQLSFGYSWKESEVKQHILYPIDWSFVNVTTSPEFQAQIDQEPNDRIRNQYIDHLILALRYSFIYNNQNIRKLRNFIFFRGNIETSGNLVNLYMNAFGQKSDSGDYYTLFNIRYAQYIRTDFDFRYYNVISRNNTLSYRAYLGAGIPYGNIDVLPLEKGFYGGGANGMRGWIYRLLGPGAYNNPDDTYDRMGDIQIEGNIEYRFPIYKFFKGSLFVDAGNIWLLSENESYPGGKFAFDSFYKEIAIDCGLGIRMDFDFFILRIDAATPARDPAMPMDERWVLDKFQFKDVLINFGIGYPF